MIIILTLSIILISNILFNRFGKKLTMEIKNRGILLSEKLATAGFEIIINKDKLFSSDAIEEIMKGDGIVYAIIVNQRNRIIDSSLSDYVLRRKVHRSFIKKHGKQIKKIKKVEFFNVIFQNKKVIDIVRPIILKYKNKEIKKGYVRIGMSQEIIDNEIKNASRSTLILAVIVILLGIVISFLFAGSITTPLLKIVNVMKKVGEGDLQQNVQISSKDEIGELAYSFNDMIQHLKEKSMMSKYMSKSTMKMIKKKNNIKLELGGERKEVTLFFSDIRGFTAYSESKTPEQVISMLNQYLSIQADIIDKYKGFVDKFVGDEVVAVFEGKTKVTNAITSAIIIQKTINKLNINKKEKIYVGIGIHVGEIVMGNMGSEKRMDYTVIGDNVNTASRLCDKAGSGMIIVSENAFKRVKKRFKFGRSFLFTLKGKSEQLKAYEVLYGY